MVAVLAVLCLSFLPPHPGAHAWNDTGHRVIALIAFRQLNAETQAKITALLEKHPSRGAWRTPADLSEKDQQAFLVMRASVWPDDIRSSSHPLNKYHQFRDHFVNLPHVHPADFSAPKGMDRKSILQGESILKCLVRCVISIRNDSRPAEERARELSWLLHTVGDIHQPLHCSNLYSKRFPKGDRGGNSLLVGPRATTVSPPPEGQRLRLPNLHSFWDGSVGRVSGYEALSKIADSLMKRKPEAFGNELKVTAFGKWADESNALAIQAAYDFETLNFVTVDEAKREFKEGKKVPIPALSEEYQDRARAISKKRATLAGYRLARLLDMLFAE